MNAPQVVELPDVEALALHVAKLLADRAASAVAERGKFVIAFAGGSTPKRLYRLLASEQYQETIPWQQTIAFWSDERYVPLDHEDSNFRLAQIELLDQVQIPPGNIYPTPTDLEPADAARKYEATIRNLFDCPPPGVPSFDVILLGIGPDGHTASLFPHTAAIDVDDRLVVENWVPQQDAMRISFTIPMLHAARQVVLMAAGTDKAEAIWKAIEGSRNLAETPSQCLRDADGDVVIVLDESAAERLSSTS